jgi:hypothetical protein
VNWQRPDDAELRDDRVASAWRGESNETPPEALDAAIRAAARSELRGKSRVTLRNNRWLPLAAAASVAALAFGVLRWLPPGSQDVAPIRSDPVSESRTPESRAPARPAPTAEQTRESDAAVAYDDDATSEPSIDRGTEETAPSAAQLDALAAEKKSSTPTRTGPAEGIASESISRRAPPAAPVAAETAAAQANREPQAWIDEIEALHAAGDYDRAAARLREFRSRHADADERLPRELRKWAATVQD